MIQSLETTQNAARNQFAPAVTSNGLSISNVSIAVGGLETDQQFADAGAAFAKELKAAIKERGLNVNKKR